MRRKGFSLVELMVVIGIIAVLLSILMPALSSARESARRAVCASNLRQFSAALNAYAQDQGAYPLTLQNTQWGWWNQWQWAGLPGWNSFMWPSAGSYLIDQIGFQPSCLICPSGAGADIPSLPQPGFNYNGKRGKFLMPVGYTYWGVAASWGGSPSQDGCRPTVNDQSRQPYPICPWGVIDLRPNWPYATQTYFKRAPSGSIAGNSIAQFSPAELGKRALASDITYRTCWGIDYFNHGPDLEHALVNTVYSDTHVESSTPGTNGWFWFNDAWGPQYRYR